MFKLIFLLFSHFSHADVTYSVESYFLMQRAQVAQSALNPGNQVFQQPFSDYSLDLRAELKWKDENQLAVVRPRFVSYDRAIEFNGQNTSASRQYFDLTDAFYERRLSAQLTLTAGLQVYQWGPAEFLNVSNPLYHFNTNQKTLVYKEKGQALLRLNFSADRENSLVVILEPVSNNQPEWIESDHFVPKFLIKFERSFRDTADYFGVVLGKEERNNTFIGQYFNYGFGEGFSLYGDAKQAQNLINYEPVANGPFYNMVEVTDGKNKWATLSVLGLRYEDSFDLRAEYIYNGMGYDKIQLKSALASASGFLNPAYAQNLKNFLKPGLEILGKNYVYLSYRLTEPFNWKEMNFYMRYLRSLQDESAQLQAEFDKSLSDQWLVFSNVTIAEGRAESEFRLLNDWQLLVGLKLGL